MGAGASAGVAAATKAATKDELSAALAGLDEPTRAKLVEALSGAKPSSDVLVSYFAIASMMNNVGLNARGLFSKQSRPGELLDHELIFYGTQGMAAAKPNPGQSFHGVLHELTVEDMCKLDKIEVGVARSAAKARLYDGTVVDCVVYCDDVDKKKATGQDAEDKLPSERYIAIMIEGAENHGVAKEYVDKLRALPKQPRKKSADFAAFDVPEGTPTWTADDVAKGDGEEGRPAYFSLNGKVLQWLVVEGNPLAKMSAKKDTTLMSATMRYDPKYGMPTCLADMSAEHKACIEDTMASEALEGGSMHGKLKLVAVLG